MSGVCHHCGARQESNPNSSLLAVAAAAAVVLMLVTGILGFWMGSRSGGEEPSQPVAQPSASAMTAVAGGQTSPTATENAGDSSPSSPGDDASGEQESGGDGYPGVTVGAGGRECARVGEGPYAAVATNNSTTSCPFAVNVRQAYVAAGLEGNDGDVTAFSPTTGRSYDLYCSGGQPVFCSGGRAAQVMIYGGALTSR